MIISLVLRLRIVVLVHTGTSLSTGIYATLPSDRMHTTDGAWRPRPLRHLHSRRVLLVDDGTVAETLLSSVCDLHERMWRSPKDEDSTPAVTPYRWDLM